MRSQTTRAVTRKTCPVSMNVPPWCLRLSVLFSFCLQGLPDAAEHCIGVDQDNAMLKGIRFCFLSCRPVGGLIGISAKVKVLGGARISQLEKPIIGIPQLAPLISPLRGMEDLSGLSGIMVRAVPIGGVPGSDEREQTHQALRKRFQRCKIRDRIRSGRKTRTPRA